MKLRGDRNQCPTCGDFFNSTAAFDKHRVPVTPKVPLPRKCLSAAQMTALGMVLRADGFWRGSAMPQRAIPEGI